jgi:hypothetical protein
MKGYVYHIKNPNDSSIEEGYIGVVNKEKGVYRRFLEHASSSKHMKHLIAENNIEFNQVEVIFEGDLSDCYALEKQLRPKQKIGWNLATGGGGPYYSEIDDLKKYRSDVQTQRMQNEEIRKKQGESFKNNYYSNPKSQELRKLRTKEHMADPEKRKKCLSAIHKKIKCPHCEFESNVGNVKRHIKAKHNEL